MKPHSQMRQWHYYTTIDDRLFWINILRAFISSCLHHFIFEIMLSQLICMSVGIKHKVLLVQLVSTMDFQSEMTCKLWYLWLLFHLSNGRTIMAMICQRRSILSFILNPMQTNSTKVTPYSNIEPSKPDVFICVKMSSLHNQNQIKYGFIDLKGVEKLQMDASCQTGPLSTYLRI